MENIQMVDLKSQYLKIKDEIDAGVLNCINSTNFIKGPEVSKFENSLKEYLQANHVIACANGTDALQLAMMALDLQPGDEVIVPAFTYVATAEVIGLLKLTPVMVDVHPDTFDIAIDQIESAITSHTKAIVPVHLFGQCADMSAINAIAQKHNLFVIEDTAQAIGATYSYADGSSKMAGTMSDIGCTSFFPSKNLGCYGDGGALFCNNAELAKKITSLANHGQEQKYIHKYIGINSRLDSIQAAILNAKLPHLKEYGAARNRAADYYDQALASINQLTIPSRCKNSTHVFHQYTIKVPAESRQPLQQFLASKGIPSMIYYPIPLQEQEAFQQIGRQVGDLHVTKSLCNSVLSLPIHTEMTEIQLEYITENIKSFFI